MPIGPGQFSPLLIATEQSWADFLPGNSTFHPPPPHPLETSQFSELPNLCPTVRHCSRNSLPDKQNTSVPNYVYHMYVKMHLELGFAHMSS